MKKNIVILFSILSLSFVLFACSNKGDSAKESSSDQVTIEFMHTSVEQERLTVIDKLIEKFEKENPNIKIKQVVTEESNLNTKIITLAQSGELPEVVEVGQDYAKVMDKDELIDKDAVQGIIESVGTDEYYDGALRLVRSEDGNSYRGVPISGWVQGIWYNKEMLESEGFEEPKNWDELLEIAKAFTDEKNQQYGIALPTVESNYSEQAFSQFALSNDANVLDADGNETFNTPEMKEALEFYDELSEYTMPGSNDTTEVKDAFMNGSAPMALYSTYLLPGIYSDGDPSNVGFAIPTQKNEAVFGTVSSFTITSGLEDKQKEAAQTFVEFMSQPENTTDWILMAPGGAQPVHKGVVENETYKSNEVIQAFGELSDEIAESFNDIQVFGVVGDSNFVKMGDITSTGAIPTMINNVTVGGQDIQKALDETEARIQEVTK
ncbi:ABC transporter substrate-binding protein [Bacillus sp. SD088]|uniref:ABC transporter substrate-binding protein n=1 Tax=Bacillus sp. SD088 TaxID=2782012 RepID=UPI001A963576|nr:sugar ABC transporter substrate-binding protein [Bacillus sp. SD088]MBO0995732.1 sugar ABC transporter substrate-binding protein [Bacillus sp. SD088]